MRDKLIELILDGENILFRRSNYFTDMERIDHVADYLLAHGVSLASDTDVGDKWIPVSEMLPTYTSDYLVYLAKPFEGKLFPLGRSIAAYIARDDCWDLPDPYIVTHWMPLPEAPKEVE